MRASRLPITFLTVFASRNVTAFPTDGRGFGSDFTKEWLCSESIVGLPVFSCTSTGWYNTSSLLVSHTIFSISVIWPQPFRLSREQTAKLFKRLLRSKISLHSEQKLSEQNTKMNASRINLEGLPLAMENVLDQWKRSDSCLFGFVKIKSKITRCS